MEPISLNYTVINPSEMECFGDVQLPPKTPPWVTRSKPPTQHGRGDRPERRSFKNKWTPLAAVPIVSGTPRQPIADNSILRGVFFVPEIGFGNIGEITRKQGG